MLSDFAHELVMASRRLRKRAGFSVMALLSLTLGIGACTAMYAVVDAVLLRQLPYPQAQRLVQVQESDADGRSMPLAQPNLIDLSTRHRGLVAIAGYGGGTTTVSSGTRSARTGAYVVGNGFLNVLRVAPALGAGFSTDVSASPGVLVSQEFWRDTLGSPPALAGINVAAFGLSLPVLGVMPAGFHFPADAHVWISASAFPTETSRSSHNWEAIARIRDGVTLAQAQADAIAVGRALQREHGDEVELVGFALTDLRDAVVGPVRTALWVLLGAVGFLLLIAATNVTNLFLAQALSRRQELAVRAALGAGHGRLARQFVIESLMLGLTGAVLGCIAAYAALGALLNLIGDSLPRAQDVHLDLRVLAMVALGTLVLSATIGLIAASRSRSKALAPELKEGGRSATAGRSSSRLRSSLVVAQGALTVVLLIGAGLLGRTFVGLLQQHPGFDPKGALAITMSLPEPDGADGDARLIARVDQLLERLGALPGVSAIGGTDGLPLSGDGSNGSFFDEHADFSANPQAMGYAEFRVASAGYFRAMAMPLLRGRGFDASDRVDTPHVALISRTFADSTWPGRDPIGQRLQFGNMDGDLHVLTVIGVVGDVRDRGLDRGERGTVYVNYAQRPVKARNFTLVLRSAGNLGALAATLRAELPRIAPDVPAMVRSLDAVYRASLATRRFSLSLFAVFAAVALALAASGLYGLMAFTVGQRTAEIAVRLALGSSPARILGMVVRQGLRLQLYALGLGVVVALFATRLMASLLFGVQANDPVTFVAVAALLLAVTVLACWLPARRAAAVSPRSVLA